MGYENTHTNNENHELYLQMLTVDGQPNSDVYRYRSQPILDRFPHVSVHFWHFEAKLNSIFVNKIYFGKWNVLGISLLFGFAENAENTTL